MDYISIQKKYISYNKYTSDNEKMSNISPQLLEEFNIFFTLLSSPDMVAKIDTLLTLLIEFIQDEKCKAIWAIMFHHFEEVVHQMRKQSDSITPIVKNDVEIIDPTNQ